MRPDAATLAKRIDQARGLVPADLVIRGARLLNTATGGIDEGDIAICGDVVVGTLARYRGRHEIDGAGLIAVPGFVDAHVHVESSLVLPDAFERAVLPRGTTTAICDPHEIANVAGMAGIRYFVAAARALAMTLRVGLSSCVPASPLETSGARLEAADLRTLADAPEVVGLAEMMSFPSVLAKEPGVLAKLAAFGDRHIDGHAPLLGGKDLAAYLAAGVRSDHECTRLDEAREKLACGMHLFLREGSVSKDVAALAALIDEASWPFLAFCTDDRNPRDIAREGHIDAAIRKAIASGAPVIPTYRAATLGAALAFGLRDRGVIAPGRRADIVLVGDLEACRVENVICGGRPVAAILAERPRMPAPVGLDSVRRAAVDAGDFAIADRGERPVIGLREGSLITEHLRLAPPSRAGAAVADPDASLHKVAVLERHGVDGGIGRGFVRGFGPLRGALAVSVGHDAHNLGVVGSDDAAMAVAVNRLIALRGGMVAVAPDGRLVAELALPIAGLMSARPLTEVEAGLDSVLDAAVALGCRLAEPFAQIAFLPLSVIPHLKLTDKGMVDVDRFALVEEDAGGAQP